MLFLDMRFDDEEMAALYRDYRGEAYTTARERFEPGYAARNAIMLEGSAYIDQIEAILEPYLGARPRVLDWGGDAGVNTPFRSRAPQHDVYDISNRPMVEGARAVGLDFVKTSVYDLIVFSNVLEHVSYPRESLRDARHGPGGRAVREPPAGHPGGRLDRGVPRGPGQAPAPEPPFAP